MNHFKNLSPLGIVIIYVLIATVWLLLSDSLIESLFKLDDPLRFYAHIGKGFFNVVWTAALIFSLTKISLNKLKASKRAEEVYATRVSNILERISDSFLSVNTAWEITYINNHLEEAFGEKRDRVIGMNIWDAIPKFSSSMIRTQLETAMNQQVTVSFQERNQRLGLELFFSAYPIDDGIAVYIQDYTKLTMAESNLLQQEKDLQFLIDSIEDNIWSIDAQGNYLSFNLSFAKLYKSYTDFYPVIG
ncbi:MAG: PAS domain S-box protein, partial [Salibacteraceae bacterium]|nr:PAS domain S-box protein [Salibacteraceae bacterium]